MIRSTSAGLASKTPMPVTPLPSAIGQMVAGPDVVICDGCLDAIAA